MKRILTPLAGFLLILALDTSSGLSLAGPGKQSGHGSTRREALVAAVFGATTVVAGASAPATADTGAEVRGTAVTPFNGLIFNYRGSDNPDTSLKASDLNEPSISYSEFVAKLKAGEVEFVEFMAPDGDAAYATLKGSAEPPIRIGEGYPIEQHDGWSSPAFAVRTVKNAGVPYKFTVPALRAYNNS